MAYVWKETAPEPMELASLNARSRRSPGRSYRFEEGDRRPFREDCSRNELHSRLRRLLATDPDSWNDYED